MPATILIGAQWGDEGKGRAVDWLASEADVVARFGGGDNAGHTVNVGETVYKLHLLPSGILRDDVMNVLGNGMVINPIKLLQEMEEIRAMGVAINPSKMMISNRAHLITPAHIAMDAAKEKARGDAALGTTLRGIGPAYLDKTGRKGLRMGMTLDLERFAEALHERITEANETLQRMDMDLLDPQAITEQYTDAVVKLQPYLADTVHYLNRELRAGKRVVCEGAQGTLLDVDHGSYPYVTSSSPSSGGVLTGLGIGPRHVDKVVGVAKAFCTRVGAGPMPTELHDDVSERLRGTGENFWDEFGTTTGRTRRTGWLDAVMLRYAVDINGFTELAVTKMDILSGFDELKIAVAYEVDGVQVDYPPSTIPELESATPVYETVTGWSEDISGVQAAADLPENARFYLDRIAALVDTPVTMIGVGPEREQLIHMQ